MESIGWNAIRLAKTAGMDPTVVYQLFKRKSGNLDTILKLAHALGLPAHELLRDESVQIVHPPHDLEDCIAKVTGSARAGAGLPSQDLSPFQRKVLATFATFDDSEMAARALEALQLSLTSGAAQDAPTLKRNKKR